MWGGGVEGWGGELRDVGGGELRDGGGVEGWGGGGGNTPLPVHRQTAQEGYS